MTEQAILLLFRITLIILISGSLAHSHPSHEFYSTTPSTYSIVIPCTFKKVVYTVEEFDADHFNKEILLDCKANPQIVGFGQKTSIQIDGLEANLQKRVEETFLALESDTAIILSLSQASPTSQSVNPFVLSQVSRPTGLNGKKLNSLIQLNPAELVIVNLR